MKLGNLLQKPPDPPPPLFLAVQLQEGLVKTAVWQVEAEKPTIVAFGTQQEWDDLDSLVVSVDASLAAALENQPSEPDRVVFGLPESWVKQDKISPEYTPHLKALIDKLELQPIGFVVITEAIIQQLKLQEGIPPTVILLELHTSRVHVVVVKLGQVLGREEVARSDDLATDVAEGLARLELEQLPSRILVINGQDADLEQQLTSYPWKENLPFLHLPKVEIPSPHFSIEAVALAGGTEAAQSLGIAVTPPASAASPDDITPASDLGFVIDQDVTSLPPQQPPPAPEVAPDDIPPPPHPP